MNKINLKIIVDALEEVFDGWSQFLNIETGEVISFPEDRDFYDGDDYDGMRICKFCSGYPNDLQ